MSSYIKNIYIADFLGAELSFLVLSFVASVFLPVEKIYLSIIICTVFLIRYMLALKQNIGAKLVEIGSVITIIILSYTVDIRLITITGLFIFLTILEKYIHNKFSLTASHILFSLIGYSFLFFFKSSGCAIFLFTMSLHLMIIIARELLYESSLQNEKLPDYTERVKKHFFISRFIIYIFFVYSPMAIALKIANFLTYMIPLFLLIDIPYIMFLSYIRISHSNRNFRRITLFISYSIPLFYLILLAGRFSWKF